MTVDFQEHFWGDKQSGFDILYQNLKCASTSAKELTEFLRSRAVIEEYNFNLLIKLSRKTNNQQFGTFNPLWIILKSSTEKLSNLHMQTLQRLNQLIKDVTKYCDEHHKKQKQIKTEETSTIDAINELRETIAALNKAKEFYYTKTVEVDRLKRENASQKDIEKAEARVNKACTEYKNLIEKHRKSKDDYEKKFRLSCKNFQKLEEDHIKQMKDYLASYFQILDSGHALIGQVYKEFQNNCSEMTTDRLLEQFIKSKGTGTTRPVDVQFEDVNPNNFQLNLPQLNASNMSSSSLVSKAPSITNYTSSADLINLDLMPQPGVSNLPSSNDFSNDSNFTNSAVFTSSSSSNLRKEGFLRSKKDKTKDRKSRNKKDSDDESNNGSISSSKVDFQESNANNENTEYMIDAEGYTVRPTPASKETDNFYSSSDSDSDSEDEKEKKIFVKINPLQNGTQISASVDQLIASAGALTLAPSSQSSRRANLSANPSPVQNDGAIKRSVSATQTAFKSNSNDLFDIFSSQGNNAANNNHKATESNNSALFANSFDPLSNLKRPEATVTPKESNPNKSSSNDRYAALSELFLTPTSEPSTSDPKTTTTSSSIAELNVLPLPPKTNSDNFNAFSVSNSSLSKSVSSTSIIGTNSFSVYKPLSKSFASSYSQSMSSNGMMSRADSVSSLSSDFRMTPISLCSSRDSSPLTIGMSDTVPIAIAFQESVGACFKGADENLCKINIIGCIKIAFSSGIIQALSSNPYLQQLSFKLKNINRLDKIILSKELITQTETNEEFSTYEINTSILQSSLRRLYEQSPNARYYNLDIFKYQLHTLPGAKNAPLQTVCYWKCEENTTNLKIDFKYNSSAFTNCPTQPLKNVQFTANIDGNVTSMTSQPEGKWDSLTKQAVWKFNEITQSTANSGFGSIKAKFDLENGPSSPSSVYVQFSSQDTTLSGLEFELVGSGYRLSLIKRQFSSGRYYCEPKVQV